MTYYNISCQDVLLSKSYIRNEDNLDAQIACSGYLYSYATYEPVESILLAAIYFIGDLLALIGNAFVVYASRNYGTFKLDKVTIIFVQHLAIADMLYIILYPFPMMVTHMARRWVFGAWGCRIISYLVTIPGTANIYFILSVSLHRFVRCAWPGRAQLITERRARVLVIVTWVLSCMFITYLAAFRVNVDFIEQFANCSWHFQSSAKSMHLALMLLTVTLPCLITTFLNISLWVFVHLYMKKHMSKASKDKKNALITTCSITALFILTWSPTVVRFNMASWPGGDGVHAAYIPEWLEKSRIIYIFGTWGNPVIYTMVNNRFRRFVIHKLKQTLQFLIRDKSSKNSYNTPKLVPRSKIPTTTSEYNSDKQKSISDAQEEQTGQVSTNKIVAAWATENAAQV